MSFNASEDSGQQHTNEREERGRCAGFGKSVKSSGKRAEEGNHSANRCKPDGANAMCCFWSVSVHKLATDKRSLDIVFKYRAIVRT